MNSHTPKSETSDYPGVTRSTCPVCGSPLHRVPRRLLDRITHPFSLNRRYRCCGFSCRWEGLMDAGADHHSKLPDSAA